MEKTTTRQRGKQRKRSVQELPLFDLQVFLDGLLDEGRDLTIELELYDNAKAAASNLKSEYDVASKGDTKRLSKQLDKMLEDQEKIFSNIVRMAGPYQKKEEQLRKLRDKLKKKPESADKLQPQIEKLQKTVDAANEALLENPRMVKLLDTRDQLEKDVANAQKEYRLLFVNAVNKLLPQVTAWREKVEREFGEADDSEDDDGEDDDDGVTTEDDFVVEEVDDTDDTVEEDEVANISVEEAIDIIDTMLLDGRVSIHDLDIPIKEIPRLCAMYTREIERLRKGGTP